MATEVVCIVDPDEGTGYDFSSMNAAEAANFGATSADITAAGSDEWVNCKCRSTDGSADTTRTIVNGQTTDSTHFIRISTDVSDTGGDGPGGTYRHNQTYPGATSKIYRLEAAATASTEYVLRIVPAYTEIVGIAIYMTSVDLANSRALWMGSSNGLVDSCLVKGASYGTWNTPSGIYISSAATGTIKVRNNVVYNVTGTGTTPTGIFVNTVSGQTAYAHANTVADCSVGILRNGTNGSSYISNNKVFGCTDAFSGTWSGGNNNAYSEGSDPASNGVNISGESGAELFLDYAGDNFHNLAGSLTDSAGINLISHSYCPVTVDAENRSRQTTPDIGADENVAQDATGDPTIHAVTVHGHASGYSPGDMDATGNIVIHPVTVRGLCFKTYRATGAITTKPVTCRGVTQMLQGQPEYEATLHGYEVFPLDPEFAVVEQIGFRVLQTDQGADYTETRVIREKALRRWRLTWNQATDSEAEIILGFQRDMRGSALPFWWDAIDPIARPYTEPEMGQVAGGSLASRTRYAKFTWSDGTNETTPSVEYDSLTVAAGFLVTVTVPEFPQYVTEANVYVGATSDDLKLQATPITTSGGTWTEPGAGYDSGGASPPTVNTLTERVLVHFADDAVQVSKSSHDQNQITVEFEEVWIENPRQRIATADITCAPVTVNGVAVCKRRNVTGAITIHPVTVHGDAEKSAGTAQYAIGHITTSSVTVNGVADLVPVADWHVMKTGNDTTGNGSAGNPYLTIGKAVTVSSSGDTIAVYGPGTYTEQVNASKTLTFVGVGRPIVSGGSYGFYVTAHSVTIQGFEIQSCIHGVYSYKINYCTIDDCIIHDCTSRGVGLLGSATNGIITTGLGCILRNSTIYNIFDNNGDGETFGCKIDYSKGTIVEDCIFYLCGKAGCRSIRSTGSTIQRNYISLCWAGIELNYDVVDASIEHNFIERCHHGMYFKHTAAQTILKEPIDWNEALNNTVYLCGYGLLIGVNTPNASWVRATRNLWKQCGDTAIAIDQPIDQYIQIDSNMYWASGGNPTIWFNYNGSLYNTIAEIRAGTPYEDNGVAYSGSTTGYGATGYATGSPAWSGLTMTVDSASHNSGTADHPYRWKFLSTSEHGEGVWYSGTGNDADEWLIYDLGASPPSWQYALLASYGDGVEHNAKTIAIQTSPDKGTWTTRIPTSGSGYESIDEKGAWKIFKLSSPVTARYVRLWLDDNWNPLFPKDWANNEFAIVLFVVGNLA